MIRSKTPGAAKARADKDAVPDTVLDHLAAAEAHQVLVALLRNQPELVPEAEGLGRVHLAPGTVEKIAGEVERYCEGFVEGLYRCHCASHGERVLDHAPNVPAGEARAAVAALRQAGWGLSGDCRDRWPEWGGLVP